jgi:hypothetical protein
VDTESAGSGAVVPLLLSAITALVGVVAYLFHRLLAAHQPPTLPQDKTAPALPASPPPPSRPDSARVRQIAREEIDAALGPAAAPVQALRRARAELEKAEEDLRRAEKEGGSGGRRRTPTRGG